MSPAGTEIEIEGRKLKLMWECKEGWWCKRWKMNAGIWSKIPAGPGWSEGCQMIPHALIDRALTAART